MNSMKAMYSRPDRLTAESLEVPSIREVALITQQMWEMGWDERNGGNISSILEEDEIKEHLDFRQPLRTWKPDFDVHELAGKYFIVTGSGKYFKNVMHDPETNLGIIRVSPLGEQLELIWGFKDGAVPTSELASHFLSHIERLKIDPTHRTIIHTHPAHVIAMTFIHELEDRLFTQSLWEMCTECIVVFPEGVGIIPWMVPGSNDIARATAHKMKEQRAVIWPQHGIFGTGASIDEAFGLIETIEKAAQIYMLIQNSTIKQKITIQNLAALAKAFKVTPRKGILDQEIERNEKEMKE